MKAAMKTRIMKYHAESFELLTLAYEYWYRNRESSQSLGRVGASFHADIRFALLCATNLYLFRLDRFSSISHKTPFERQRVFGSLRVFPVNQSKSDPVPLLICVSSRP